MSIVADMRMKAIRFEEKEDWAAASLAWHEALAALRLMTGSIVAAMHHEFMARALAAESRADEPMGFVQPLHKVEAQAEADEKPDAERNPGAVTHLDAGETQGSTGAR